MMDITGKPLVASSEQIFIEHLWVTVLGIQTHVPSNKLTLMLCNTALLNLVIALVLEKKQTCASQAEDFVIKCQ